jgi:hypothetical protein
VATKNPWNRLYPYLSLSKSVYNLSILWREILMKSNLITPKKDNTMLTSGFGENYRKLQKKHNHNTAQPFPFLSRRQHPSILPA